MIGEALEPCLLRDDAKLRCITEREEAILSSYLNGSLELPHPPFFINEVLPSLQRTQLREYHDRYLLYRLTATVPPVVRIPRGVSQRTIMEKLFASNTRRDVGQTMIRRLMHDLDRVTYDGAYILTFVFTSHNKAKAWINATLRLQNGLITLKGTAGLDMAEARGAITPDQLDLCYKVKLLQTKDLGATALHLAMQQIARVSVLQVTRPVKQVGQQTPDNNFWEVIFKTATCPTPLMGDSCILVEGAPILVHHHQTRFNVPCFRCYNPGHPAPYCKVPDDLRDSVCARFSKVFTGKLSTIPTISPKHVLGASIAKVTAMLHAAIARHLTEDEQSKNQAAGPATRDLSEEADVTGQETSVSTRSSSMGSKDLIDNLPKPTDVTEFKTKQKRATKRTQSPEAREKGFSRPQMVKPNGKKTKKQLRFDAFLRQNQSNGFDILQDDENEETKETEPPEPLNRRSL